MSNSDAVRGPAYGGRRTAATAGARPRVASSRIDARDYSDPAGEVYPQDSASNAPERRKSPVVAKSHRSTRNMVMERRSERTTTTTKDTLQSRTRSPAKARIEKLEAHDSPENKKKKKVTLASLEEQASILPGNIQEALRQLHLKS